MGRAGLEGELSKTSAGVWLTVASGFAFASSGPFAKSVLAAGWSPGTAVALRLTGSALAALALAAVIDRRGLRDSLGKPGTVAVYGIIALASVQATFFLSLNYLQVSVALMIQFLAPIAVIGWNWAVRRRRPSWTTLVGAAVALGGATLVVDVFAAEPPSLIGLVWAFLSMAGFAVFFVLSERSSESLSPVAMLGSGLVVAAAAAWAVGATGLLPLVTGGDTATLAGHDIPVALSLALLILISTVTAYLCSVAGAARIGSTLMSLVLLSEVPFAVALSWLLLGERVSVAQVAGGALVVSGIALARRGAEVPMPDQTPAHAVT